MAEPSPWSTRPTRITAWAAACFGALAGSACADADIIELQLIHAPGLSPADSFTELTFRFVDTQRALVVHQASAAGPKLAAEDLLVADALEDDRQYIVSMTANAPSVCANGQATGRSLPFPHRSGDYSITLQIGCADELAPTRGDPVVARMLPGLVAEPGGTAVVVGGARVYDTTDEIYRAQSPEKAIERYHPSTGRFTPAGELTVPRAAPATLVLPSKEIAVIGGYEVSLSYCSTAIEAFAGIGTVTVGNLTEARCEPRAVMLEAAERVAIIGGTLDPESTADAEAYDTTLRTRTHDAVSGAVRRYRPEVIPLADGRSALVIGGTVAPGDVAVERFEIDEEDLARFEPVAAPSAPTDGWLQVAASYVPCPQGGGAIYVTGGVNAAASEVHDGIWCYRDEPGHTGSLEQIGSLRVPRSSHLQVTVGSGAEPRQILVIGGTTSSANDPQLPHMDAVLMRVDGCACEASDAMQTIPIPFQGLPLFASAAVLADGTVLVTGGFEIDPADSSLTRLVATRDAALFVPGTH